MKKSSLLICAAFLISSSVFSQNSNPIKIEKDRLILATVVSSSDMDMGMGMQMKTSNIASNKLLIIGVDATGYQLSNTVTKLKTDMDFMGQQTNYDSDKPEDNESETGKAVAAKLNKPDTVSLDKLTGKVTRNKRSSEDMPEVNQGNPLTGLMSSMNSSTDVQVVENAFFIIPAGKKTGDSWSDSTSDKSMKSKRIFTIKSIEGNTATISYSGTIDVSGNQEIQGSEVAITMNTKLTGEIIFNPTTNLVSKRTMNSDISGTIEMMGQAMPVTAKLESSFTYQ